jgi:hypothetical protein
MGAHDLHRGLTVADPANLHFQILRPVVIFDSVLVLDRLARAQGSTQLRLHDDPVLMYGSGTLSHEYVAGSI